MHDTEEFCAIDLNSSQNQLFRLEIVLTAATFALAMYHVVAGNLRQIGRQAAEWMRLNCLIIAWIS
jgi:hypothetical protein